jgi:hypothetical protein
MNALKQEAANLNEEDLFSVAELLRGQNEPPKKKPKSQDIRHLAYIRFNPHLGKAKLITLKCLLDSGASGSILAGQHHAKKLRI